ncbi:MAG: hypothetical protein ABI588_02505 [Arenimonas sp.]
MSVEARHQPKTSGHEAAKPDGEQSPEEPEDTPPGEHKREPIKDPDPADTRLHVQHGSR